jgi:hypothetical protein
MVRPTSPPRLDSLFDLACRNGVDIRPTLLRVLTDLYVQKPAHSSAEATQYVELALGLIDTVDAATRATIAARLAAYRGAPAAVLHRLESFGALTGDDEAPLIEAAAPVPEDLTASFFAADVKERSLILTTLDAAADPRSIRSTPAAAEMVRQLESAALARNAAEFGRLLCRTLDIEHELATRIVRDDSGEPLVVATKALGIPDDVFQRIVMFLNPAVGQSVGRVHTLARLYEDVTPNAAARMVSIWRGEIARTRPAYAPLYWDDEQRSARSLSSPAPRRLARERDDSALKARSGGR